MTGAEHQRQRRAHLRREGLCTSCGRLPVAEGHVRCDSCERESRKMIVRKQRARAGSGLCVLCDSSVVPGRQKCARHLEQARLAVARKRRDRISRGLCCQCDRPATAGQYCRDHWFRSIASLHGGALNAAAIRGLFDDQGGRCALTGRELTPGVNASLDHRVPRSLGGKHELGNVRWVDLRANLAKQNLSEEEFLRLCRDVVRCADNAQLLRRVA